MSHRLSRGESGFLQRRWSISGSRATARRSPTGNRSRPSRPRQVLYASDRRFDITSDASADDSDDPNVPERGDDSSRSDDPTDRIVTRRRLLLGAASGVGLLGGGGLYRAWPLGGDPARFDAPDSQPMVTTRGRLDAARPTARSGSWDFDGADAVILYVHGLGADAESARDQAYSARLGLAAATDTTAETDGPPVVGYSWASDVGWREAKRIADENAAPLAEWLAAWADGDGRSIHLFAYSLGARVTGETLRELADRGWTDVLTSVSLFGGAIPNDSVASDGRDGSAASSVDAPVFNFHSRNDRVLGWVYRVSDRTRAVGHGGIAPSSTAPTGYTDVDVTDLVADHYSYFKPEEGCLPRAVDRLGIE